MGELNNILEFVGVGEVKRKRHWDPCGRKVSTLVMDVYVLELYA